MDGGAVVNYYLLRKLNQLRPRDKYWVAPKVVPEYDGEALPFAEPVFAGDYYERVIPDVMAQNDIPVLNLFHVGRTELQKLLEPVHAIGGKLVLHQTVHWLDDDIFKFPNLKDFDVIVAPTMYAKRAMMKVAKLSPRRIAVIPHGVPMDEFKPHRTYLRADLGIRPDQKVFLYTGRLSSWKGVVEIIKMMKKIIRKYDAVFIFRGAPFKGLDVSARIDYLLSTFSARSRNVIYLPNWASPDFMTELFAIANYILFVSGHEGFGVPLLEAMANKLPFITTTLSNTVEIGGQNTLCGVYLPPSVQVGTVNDGTPIKVPSARAIASACVYLLENPEESQIMGERGYRRCKKNFALNKVAKMWLELYDNIVPSDYDMTDNMEIYK